jgi:predicted MFS family arabinose efflux permease
MGFVATLELGSLAITSILTAMYFNRTFSRWSITVALLASITANILAGLPPSIGVFVLARAIAGGANGFLLAEFLGGPRKVLLRLGFLPRNCLL